MAWWSALLSDIRDAVLDGTVREFVAEFVATLFVMFLASFVRNFPKNLLKLKTQWKGANLKQRIKGVGVAVLFCVGAYCTLTTGLRLWRNYIKPVQYLDTEVSFYAGAEDLSVNLADLHYPDHIAADGIDVVYVWDSEEIHELRASREEKYGLGSVQPNKSRFIESGDYGMGNYAVDALHVRKGELYALTAPWRDYSAYPDGEHFDYRFTILRVRGGDRALRNAEEAGTIPSNVTDMMDEPFYAGTDWAEIRFTDFLLSNDGDTLWIARQDIGNGTVILERILHVADKESFSSENLEWFADLQYDVTDNNKPRLAMDEKGNLYISAPEDHEILRFNFAKGEDSFKIFAGNEHKEGSHRDGPEPRFVNPTSIAVKGDYLYVYDSGTVRRVSLRNGTSVTMAGRFLPDGEGDSPFPNRTKPKVSGEEAVLPCGQYPGMTVLDNGTVLLCNRENGVIYRITERHSS